MRTLCNSFESQLQARLRGFGCLHVHLRQTTFSDKLYYYILSDLTTFFENIPVFLISFIPRHDFCLPLLSPHRVSGIVLEKN